MELSVQEALTVALAVMPVAVAGQLTVSPVAGLVTALRLIVPAKLNVLVSETDMAAPVAPELKFTGVLTVILKSPTWTTDDAEWEAVPGDPEPVKVTR